LKGGGQITEAEGAKATDAMSRLGQTNVRESEYKKAAQELVDILKAARSRVKGGDKVDPDNSTAVDDLLKKYIK